MKADVADVRTLELDGRGPAVELIPHASDRPGADIAGTCHLAERSSRRKYACADAVRVENPGSTPIVVVRFDVTERLGADLDEAFSLDADLVWHEEQGPPDSPDVMITCEGAVYHAWWAGFVPSQVLLARAVVDYTSIAALSLVAGLETIRTVPDPARHRFAFHVQQAAELGNVFEVAS